MTSTINEIRNTFSSTILWIVIFLMLFYVGNLIFFGLGIILVATAFQFGSYYTFYGHSDNQQTWENTYRACTKCKTELETRKTYSNNSDCTKCTRLKNSPIARDRMATGF